VLIDIVLKGSCAVPTTQVEIPRGIRGIPSTRKGYFEDHFCCLAFRQSSQPHHSSPPNLLHRTSAYVKSDLLRLVIGYQMLLFFRRMAGTVSVVGLRSPRKLFFGFGCGWVPCCGRGGKKLL
jgi:hypothetical protein